MLLMISHKLILLMRPLLATTENARITPHWFVQLLFAISLLLSAAFVFQGMWNGLMAEFPQIGRLSYTRAIHVVSIMGLALIVLAWILF